MTSHILCTRRLLFGLPIALFILGFAASAGATAGRELGVASFYGAEFDKRPTASGEPFDMHAMTAAHPTLPFGTRVRVTNLSNGRSTVVRINDRGPFLKGRVLDLSFGAARALRLVGAGVGRVRVEPLPRAYASARRHWPRGASTLEPIAARRDRTRVTRTAA